MSVGTSGLLRSGQKKQEAETEGVDRRHVRSRGLAYGTSSTVCSRLPPASAGSDRVTPQGQGLRPAVPWSDLEYSFLLF